MIPLWTTLAGCLLLQQAPGFVERTFGDSYPTYGLWDSAPSAPVCVDADCPGGLVCEFGECRTDCVLEEHCRPGFRCCLPSASCPVTDTRIFECIPGGW